MKKLCVVSFVVAVALGACSKQQANTTPSTDTPGATGGNGSSIGGSSYGGTSVPSGPGGNPAAVPAPAPAPK